MRSADLNQHYILEGTLPIAVSAWKWAQWFESHTDERIVARTRVGNAEISTVFLGLNHNYGDGPPLLFETLVFYDPLLESVQKAHPGLSIFEQIQRTGSTGEMQRYTTWTEAEQGHQEIVEKLRKELNDTSKRSM